MSWMMHPEGWIAFATLFALELVLGIDNVIFLAILSSKLPVAQQAKARVTGLSLAVLMRFALILSISWVIGLTSPLFSILGKEISGRDIILIAGGLFLIAKSTHEIHDKLEGEEDSTGARVPPGFAGVIVQIVVLDAVFSLDSVITAVGLVQEIGIMVAAVIASVIFMMVFAGTVSGFVERHPTVKMLALSFLLLIGVTLIVEGFDVHVPRGYIYFAMAFSVFVEMLNLRVGRKKVLPVQLRQTAASKLKAQ
jgi:predicted tellurium resistance membrane protein TerC